MAAVSQGDGPQMDALRSITEKIWTKSLWNTVAHSQAYAHTHTL